MSNAKYLEDRRWSDAFMPEVKSIVGQVLLSDSFEEEDRERNTDLIVLKMEAKRVGVRIRRESQLQWSDEFTIRASRPKRASGGEPKTEFLKIMDGFGDYFFYGFGHDSPEDGLIKWVLGDLTAFRDYCWITREKEGKEFFKKHLKKNVDGSSEFYWFKISEVPNFVIASSDTSRLTSRGWVVSTATHGPHPRRLGNGGKYNAS